ncbi:MAG: hypothetical protein EBV86_09045 [Marivivens sp.]|nr:hypothetical protein [Marivivens sp.]
MANDSNPKPNPKLVQGEEASMWYTLVSHGLDPETVEFYIELGLINQVDSFYYAIEALEGFKDYLSQEPCDEDIAAMQKKVH